ncbi:MAG: hypothetical protein ACRDK4_06775 [Solirubrobacteraceae bacterium]
MGGGDVVFSIADHDRAGVGREFACRASDVDRLSTRGLVPLLDYLRGLDAVSPASTLVTPVEQLVKDYCEYLLRERGLAPGSRRITFAGEGLGSRASGPE